MRVAIVGGGIIGLSTGLYLLKHPPKLDNGSSLDVTIITDKITPNTTADGAAGIWSPYLLQKTPEDQQHRWAKETHDLITELWTSPAGDAGRKGISLISACRLNTEHSSELPSWHDIVYGYRKLTRKELDNIGRHEGRHRKGSEFITFTIEPVTLLPHFIQEFKDLGGSIKTGIKITDLAALGQYFDLVINCTGLWARYLTNDAQVNPLRGQVMRVKAPWIKRVILDDLDDGKYIISNQNSVVLGGTHQASWDTTPSAADREEILSGCHKIRPADVAGAEHIKDWVGLRPGRPAVRLEREKMTRQGGHKSTEVIHNYGHGGSGITIFWGCAKEVRGLVQDVACEQSVLASKL